jgi:hypothetical protein
MDAEPRDKSRRAGQPGRPRHPATDQVIQLLAQGLKEREIVATLADTTTPIGKTTVNRIRHGRKEAAASLLSSGERRLAKPVPCPNGCPGLLAIVPCRTCGVTWPVELDELNRAADRRQLAASQRRPA